VSRSSAAEASRGLPKTSAHSSDARLLATMIDFRSYHSRTISYRSTAPRHVWRAERVRSHPERQHHPQEIVVHLVEAPVDAAGVQPRQQVVHRAVVETLSSLDRLMRLGEVGQTCLTQDEHDTSLWVDRRPTFC